MATRCNQISENFKKTYRKYDTDTPKGLKQMQVAMLIEISNSLGILVDMYGAAHGMYPSEYKGKYETEMIDNMSLRRENEQLKKQLAALQADKDNVEGENDG